MRNKETAIKTAENRRIETPETRRLFDYSVGDYIQITGNGEAAGKVGQIIGIRNFYYEKDGGADLAYTVKLSDKKSIEISAGRMRFLRHAEEPPTPAENGKI